LEERLALDEGRRAIALTPVEKDVVTERVLQYIRHYSNVGGRQEFALQQLELGSVLPPPRRC